MATTACDRRKSRNNTVLHRADKRSPQVRASDKFAVHAKNVLNVVSRVSCYEHSSNVIVKITQNDLGKVLVRIPWSLALAVSVAAQKWCGERSAVRLFQQMILIIRKRSLDDRGRKTKTIAAMLLPRGMYG